MFSRRPSSLADGGAGIALVPFNNIIFVIPATSRNAEMEFVIRAIVV